VPTSGDVRYKGTVLPSKPYRVTQAGIARTFQNIRLFANMTVLENVMVGRHSRTKEGLFSAIGRGPRYRAAERDARDNAHELLELPRHRQARGLAGPQPAVRRDPAQAGDRPRHGPATRALILLDEPTAGMNPQETRATQEVVFKIRERGLAVIVIEHDMRFIFNLCDRVAVLVQGRKLVEGSPAQVQADERVVAAYLGTPVADTAGSDPSTVDSGTGRSARRVGR